MKFPHVQHRSPNPLSAHTEPLLAFGQSSSWLHCPSDASGHIVALPWAAAVPNIWRLSSHGLSKVQYVVWPFAAAQTLPPGSPPSMNVYVIWPTPHWPWQFPHVPRQSLLQSFILVFLVERNCEVFAGQAKHSLSDVPVVDL
jgi:hypothetical protein